MEASLPESIANAVRQAGVDDPTIEMVADGVFVLPVRGGERAVEIWKTLSAQSDSLGGWPVIVGDSKRFSAMKEALHRCTLDQRKAELERAPDGSPSVALRQAELDMRRRRRDLFAQRGIEVPQALREYLAVTDAQKPIAPDAPAMPDSFAIWALTAQASEQLPVSVNDLRGKPLKECMLAIVASARAFDVPALLCFGGFNDCPRPSIQVAYCCDWNRRFGAVPMCVSHDVLELYVPRPPATPEETWRVACEQAEYCEDIVSQGTGTVEKLAQSIWKANYWFFWWD